MNPVDIHHALLVIGWALHFVFVSFVVTGTGTVLLAALSRGKEQPGPLESAFADWLPVALSGAITAAVVPLLFVQTLHPEAFYSASIVLFWRALPLLPALVGGFYLLYVVKQAHESRRVRAGAAAGSLACWLFAAFTWTSIHMLTGDDWVAAFGGGPFSYFPAGLVPRVLAWLGLMVPIGLAGVAWLVRTRDGVPVRRMALAAVVGAALAIVAGVAHLNAVERFHDVSWRGVTLAGIALGALGWLPALRRGGRLGAAVALTSVGAVVAVAGAALLRESMRFPADEWTRPVADAVGEGQGLSTFLVFTVLVVSAVVWIFRTVARDLRAAPE